MVNKPKFPRFAGKMAESGLTLEQCAKCLDMSPTMLSRRLNGQTDFDLAEIAKAMELFHCSFDDLFGE